MYWEKLPSSISVVIADGIFRQPGSWCEENYWNWLDTMCAWTENSFSWFFWLEMKKTFRKIRQKEHFRIPKRGFLEYSFPSIQMNLMKLTNHSKISKRYFKYLWGNGGISGSADILRILKYWKEENKNGWLRVHWVSQSQHF